AMIAQGRLHPFSFLLLIAIHNFVPNLIAYKVLILISVLLDLVVLYLFLNRLSKSLFLSTLACFIVGALIQFRIYHDPLLAYHTLMETIMGLTFCSLLFLLVYLDSKRREWFLLSIVVFLPVLLSYEIPYVFFLLHFCLIFCKTSDWRRTLVLT